VGIQQVNPAMPSMMVAQRGYDLGIEDISADAALYEPGDISSFSTTWKIDMQCQPQIKTHAMNKINISPARVDTSIA
jgi:hypothetical protein